MHDNSLSRWNRLIRFGIFRARSSVEQNKARQKAKAPSRSQKQRPAISAPAWRRGGEASALRRIRSRTLSSLFLLLIHQLSPLLELHKLCLCFDTLPLPT